MVGESVLSNALYILFIKNSESCYSEKHNCFSQAGGMDAANKLPKIKDQEKESEFGYVFAVSGPGEYRSDHSYRTCII